MTSEKSQLPLEILPLILDQLQWRIRDLHACCLVSRAWNAYATSRLYSRLFLREQRRLIKVFQTLEEYAHLARLLRVLEIRVFPFGLQSDTLERLEASLLTALLNATNLEELYWTRTGSLTDRVIPFLPVFPSLHTIELTGSSRSYSPENITKHLVAAEKTPKLRHFSILLPDRHVCDELPRWALAMGRKLQSFSILCQHTAVVTDSVLQEIAKYLTGISRLSIAGAKRITVEGVAPLLQSGALTDLALEGLAVLPASFPRLASSLSQLRSLSLTYPRQTLCPPQEFWQHFASFVEDLPQLTELTFYRSSWNTSRVGEEDVMDEDADAETELSHELAQLNSESSQTPQEYRRHELEEHARSGMPIIRDPRLSTSFLRRLLSSRGASLTKLRIHGIVSTMEQVSSICTSCPDLKDLVVQLFEDDKSLLQTSLAKLPNLVSLHILSPLYGALFLTEQELSSFARQCSTTLRQIGFRNRVWLVHRQAPLPASEVSDDDLLDDGRQIILRRWDMSAGTFPEVLLVVRA